MNEPERIVNISQRDEVPQQPTAKVTVPDVVPVDAYISSLSPKEYKAYCIAKSHLDMSFDIEKSIGYVRFIQTDPVATVPCGHLRS